MKQASQCKEIALYYDNVEIKTFSMSHSKLQ